jgi:putative ABC transport system substrate-binding protein
VINRRAFIGSLAIGALAEPRSVLAQPSRKIPRIGLLNASATTSIMIGPEPRSFSIIALLRGLRELGYVYGRDFVTEPRGGEGKPERYPELAAELVRLQVDVIVSGEATLFALKQETSTIPVVMAGATDPVGGGFVQSLGRPGTNFTGLSAQKQETAAKRLEVLKEFVPRAAPVTMLWDRSNLLSWQATESAARDRGWKLLSFEIREVGEIQGAFKAATDARADAVLVDAGSLLEPHRPTVTELAARSRLPAMYADRFYVELGGLMSYAADRREIWRRAAVFVDKILKGAKPADLPVEQPTKFELVINLKAAKAIGLTIPPSLLLRADQVIE